MSTESNTPDPPLFAPVPLARSRHDGWTPDRQVAFIHALWRLPSVTHAARGVGMTARSAYRLRARSGAEEFAAAWDAALDIGHWEALGSAIARAVEGEERPVRYRGRIVGTRRVHDNGLLIACLAAGRAAPSRRRADAAGTAPPARPLHVPSPERADDEASLRILARFRATSLRGSDIEHG